MNLQRVTHEKMKLQLDKASHQLSGPCRLCDGKAVWAQSHLIQTNTNKFVSFTKNPVMLLTVQTPNLPGPCFESKTILSELPSSFHSQTLLNRTFAVQILHLLPSCLTQVQSKTSLWIQPGPFFIRVWWQYDVKATTCFIYLETWKTSRDQLA